MKQVVNISLGGRCYTLENDAYSELKSYLEAFRSSSSMGSQTGEMMDEVEMSIADILDASLVKSHVDVVNESMVHEIINRLGMPDGSSFNFAQGSGESPYIRTESKGKPEKKFFRDPDDARIAGVCSGLAAFFDTDVAIFRIVFVVALLCGTAGFWVYAILWIAMPKAETAAEKCMMRGEEITADNMKRYSSYNK